jgi:MFS family permease
VTRSAHPLRVLTPLGLAVSLSLFGDLTLYAVLITQLDVVGLSLAAVGVMLGVNRLVRIPSNPLTGTLLDRWGRRWLFVLGMLLGVLSTASYGLVRGFWPFLASRLTWGIAWTLINVGGLAMVLDISTQSDRGRLTGTYNTWLKVGFVFGPLVGGLLVYQIGFRSAMLACASLTAVGLTVAIIALPETAHSISEQAQISPRFNPRRRLGDAWHQVEALLRSDQRLATAMGLHSISLFAGEGVILATFSLLLQQRFGEEVAVGGLVIGIAAASGILLGMRSTLAGITGPLAGHLSDKYVGRWSVIAGSLVLGIAGFGLLFFADSLWLVVLGLALGAIGGGGALAVLAAYVGDVVPPGKEGVIMGAYATAGDIGSTAGPFLAFALVSVADLQWVYLVCTITFLVGLWFICRLRRTALSQKPSDCS